MGLVAGWLATMLWPRRWAARRGAVLEALAAVVAESAAFGDGGAAAACILATLVGAASRGAFEALAPRGGVT